MANDDELNDDELKGVTLFTVEHDAQGWKAVQTRDKIVIRESYALDVTAAQTVRTMFINEFWGNQLN